MMKGDKTDIIMGMVFGFVPIGLLFLSIYIYSYCCRRSNGGTVTIRTAFGIAIRRILRKVLPYQNL